MDGATGNYATISGAEIFATGKHNGDVYTTADLDQMVSAFNDLDYKPAIKAGHSDAPGAPALGYCDNVRRSGDKLIADFVDVPDGVAEQIKSKAFNRVSAEVFFDFERAGKKYKRALKAVALLGAEVPAVAGLRPLSACFAEIQAVTKHYDWPLPHQHEDKTMTKEEIQALISASLAEQATAHAAELKKLSDAAEAKLADTVAGVTKTFQTQLETVTAGQRSNTIDALVATCRIPALRHSIRVFADLATNAPATKKYALSDVKDGKVVEGDAMEALKALIGEINSKGAKLFVVQSQTTGNGAQNYNADDSLDNATTQGDIQSQVDEKVKAYMAEKSLPVAKYGEAMTAVMADPKNADLKAAYENIRSYAAA